MQRDATPRPFLGGVIPQFDAGGQVAIPAKHRIPGQLGDLAGAQAGFH